MQNIVGAPGDVAATPRGMGSMSIMPIKIEGLLVTQTLAPESTTEVAGAGH